MQQFGEFSLVQTKLAPPRIGSAPVTREGLLQQLGQRRDRTLTVALGPAGCGKTMLLTQWRRELQGHGADVAWYNAGADDDEYQIAAYIVEGLRNAGVAINTENLMLFARSGGKAWKPFLASLVNDVIDHDKNIYFFIDDFHYISSFTILQLVDRWLAAAPPQFHLVLGTRTRPPLDLSALRSADQVTELDFQELKFSAEETRRFIEAQGISGVESVHVEALQEITDGWAAGLQLLAFSLRKQSQPDAFLAQQSRLSLSQEDALNNYLDKAVAEDLSEDEFGFLTRISVCRRFNRALCELLTGDPRARDYLAKFEAENLFLLPIDTTDIEPWYRFHRLFANFLQRRLRELDAGEVRKLHQLASHWFAGQNLHVEALRHARLADDTDFTVELIDRVARPMINAANFHELLHWCETVPRERLQTRINTILCLGWAQLSCSRVDDFNRTVADIEPQLARAKPKVRTEVQLLKAFRDFRRDDTAAQLTIVEPMLQQAPPDNTFQRLLLHNLAGLGLVYANRFDEAREVVRWQRQFAGGESTDSPRPFLDVIQGMSHLVQGHIRLAVEQLVPVFRAAQHTTAIGTDALSFIVGYLVEAYYQHDELDRVRELLDQHLDMVDTFGSADSLLFCYRVRARLEQLEGDTAAARRTLQRLEEIGYQQSLDRLLAWSLYEQLLLALRSDHKASVDEILRRLARLDAQYGDLQDCARGEIPLAVQLARAEAAFAREQPDCQEQLQRAQQACRARGRELPELRTGLLQAAALLRGGDERTALRDAAALMANAQALGMKRVLADLGGAGTAVSQALLRDAPDAPYRELLRSATPAPESRDHAAGSPEQVELLTARETDVLIQLSQGLSTKGIARELALSAGTVKWHLKNIYGKLGAFSRDDALTKARAARLIP